VEGRRNERAGDVACLIAEPIQGVGGFTVPPDGFFAAMKEVCDAHGILFVSDEVQTGWGRTGDHYWGIDAHGVEPDLLTFAKGLGNGLTIAGVVARAELMDGLTANSISTFGGNPLSAAGALANLEYALANDLQANAAKVGTHLLDELRARQGRWPGVAEVRGRGLMAGIELVRPGTREPDPQAAAAALEHTKRSGVLIGKGGLHGNVLRIAPPLTLTVDEADRGIDALDRALREETTGG
jgi:4-aminobutyrate aminotransferase